MGTRVGVPYLALEGLRILLASRDDPFCSDYATTLVRALHEEIRDFSANAAGWIDGSWFAAELEATHPNGCLIPTLQADPSDPRGNEEPKSLKPLVSTRIDFPGLYHFIGYLSGLSEHRASCTSAASAREPTRMA